MRKNTKFGLNALIITLVTVAAVILVNAVITTIAGKTSLKIDLTQDKVYEFSEQTKTIMKELDKEITVYALYPPNTESNEYITYAEEYLAKYEALSKNFKVQYIDPYSNPGFAKKYESQGQTIDTGSIILECGENTSVVHMYQMYTQNSLTGSTSIDMEKKITTAVMQVTGKIGKTKVYFVEGHNEYPSIELASILSENSCEIATVNIGQNGIPEDATMLVMLAPSTDLTVEEVDALDAYLTNGGKALFAFEAGMPSLERLNSYLGEWGIVPTNDFIVETNPDRLYRVAGNVVSVPTMLTHDITDNLIGQKLVYMTPTMSSLVLDVNNINRAQLTPLMGTTEDSWGKVNFTSLDKEEGDNEGPLVVAAMSELPDINGGRILVIGSLTAIENEGILQESSYANGDFMLNAIRNITETSDSMDIRSKKITASSLTMTETQVVIMVMCLQYILPLLIVILGLFVWLKRRYK